MLLNLHIRNVALIEETEIDFGEGLNILSGETGAGKSMVIDSLNFALGERIGKDFIRNGASSAVVEALFSIADKGLEKILAEQGIPLEEDHSLLIARTLNNNGKTINRINGNTVTVSMLRSVSEMLLDIHGQHEHQSLLKPKKHIELLDKFCGEELEGYKKQLSVLYRQYRDIIKSLKSLEGSGAGREQKMDLLSFQIHEITNAKLKKGEEEALGELKRKILNSEKMKRLSGESLELLYEGSEEGLAAIDAISRSVDNLRMLKEIDTDISPVLESLETAYAVMEDCTRELSRYCDRLDPDEENIDDIENRLNTIYQLKKKYGGSIQEILDKLKELTEQYNRLSGSEAEIKRLTADKKKTEQEIYHVCQSITAVRKSKAEEIGREIETQLHELQMKGAKFEIHFERKKEFTVEGWDTVEFLISANPGENLKPLAKIASGGEMSRVMLALKSVLADADTIDTFIFDEIDTGVSGRAAQKVAEKMAGIGKTHQIICITHLPQIAAMADHHFLIEKQSDVNHTVTQVYALSRDNSISEIARLMGGVQITEATIKAAEEMKNLADAVK